MIREWLQHPLARGLDLDDPGTTRAHRLILSEKIFLNKLYRVWYRQLAGALPPGKEPVLELGSGAGFLEQVEPGLITSEVFHLPNVSAVLDGHNLPFQSASLRAILMVDVLHHLHDPSQFFREASRCLRGGGVIAMIEPWVSSWSRLIYTRFHHEPFSPKSPTWQFEPSGPLSAANSALPWMIFDRDRAKFESAFPELEIPCVKPQNPFLYLASGGMRYRSLAPGWSFPLWLGVEKVMQPWMGHLAMFAMIVVQKGS